MIPIVEHRAASPLLICFSPDFCLPVSCKLSSLQRSINELLQLLLSAVSSCNSSDLQHDIWYSDSVIIYHM